MRLWQFPLGTHAQVGGRQCRQRERQTAVFALPQVVLKPHELLGLEGTLVEDPQCVLTWEQQCVVQADLSRGPVDFANGRILEPCFVVV